MHSLPLFIPPSQNRIGRFLPAILIPGFALLAGPLPAATRTVTSLADSGSGSLRATIAVAESSDIIQFGVSGTITLTSELEIKKNLTISHDNPDTLIVELNPPVVEPLMETLEIGASVDYHTISISGITVQKAAVAPPGVGAFYGSNVALTISNCVFRNFNAPGEGAAVSFGSIILDVNNIHPSSLVLNNCTFTGNSSTLVQGVSQGGALYVRSNNNVACTLNINSCTFTGNSATQGGAIYCSNMNGSNGSVSISGTFTGNTSSLADGLGGAIYATNSFVNIGGSTFSGNQAYRGGAIYSTGVDGDINFRQSCCRDNKCSSGGMDFYLAAGSGALVNATLLSSVSPKGSVSCAGGTMVVTSCLLNGISNLGTLSLGNTIIDPLPLTSTGGTVTSNGYNLCSTDGGGFLHGTGDQVNTNPRLDPRGLRNNGGPTLSVALLGDSPAIDRGLKFGLTQDQRYLARPVNHTDIPNATGGDGSDIGPVEMSDLIQGSPIQVTTLDDHDDGNATVGDCTLREAINAAGINGFPTAILFAPGLTGTLTLKPALGAMSISSSVAITGPGARSIAIDAAGTARLFNIHGTGIDCILSGLTLKNGNPGFVPRGGAIDNSTSLTIQDCAFSSNQVNGLPGSQAGTEGATAQGGAVNNTGTLKLARCTFSGNAVKGGSGAPNAGLGNRGGNGGGGLGSAVFNDTSATLTVENCTFYNNSATGGPGGGNTDWTGGTGGAGRGSIYNLGSLRLSSCTLSGNTSTGGGGGVGSNQINHGSGGASGGALTNSGVATLHNTLCAGNTPGSAPDVAGTFNSSGFNLIGVAAASSGFTASTDHTGTSASPLNALLGPFQNNGGQTDTLLPAAGSPAIDAGGEFSLFTDQRNNTRPFDNPSVSNAPSGNGTDIGAVESGATNSLALRIVFFEKGNGFVSVTARGVPNQYFFYQLQRSSDLTSPFSAVSPFQNTDSTGMAQFFDADPGPQRGFYRVVEEVR